MGIFCVGFFAVILVVYIIGVLLYWAELSPNTFEMAMGCIFVLVLAAAGGIAAFVVFGS